MFSHVLVAYHAALLDFATKTSYTFQAALKILEEKPQYSFTILKDLTQVPVVRDNPAETKEIAPLDFDQMLFFKVRTLNGGYGFKNLCFAHFTHFEQNLSHFFSLDHLQEDFEDEVKASQKDDSSKEKTAKQKEEETTQSKAETAESATSETKTSVSDSMILDLLDISTNEPTETDCLLDIFSNAANSCKPMASAQTSSSSSSSSSNLSAFDFLKKIHGSTAASASSSEASKKGVTNKSKMNIDKKTSAWMDLFADLDPLANPTTIEKKIAGLNQNCLDA